MVKKSKDNAGATQNSDPSPPRLIVIGAGPKAAALAAKARVLKDLGIGEIKIDVVERESDVAANWLGTAGFTTGKVQLCTPPEKDVGFPYASVYGSEVDKRMLVEYSWHAYKILLDNSSYSDWVDTGREHPTHEEWGRYLNAILRPEPTARSEAIRNVLSADDVVTVLTETSAERIEPDNGHIKVTTSCRGRKKILSGDGVVLTGPGAPTLIDDMPDATDGLILNCRDYWQEIQTFRGMKSGQVAVIGGGEAAAAIVISLLDITYGSSVKVDIVNRHGAIFSRGESYNESRRFSNPRGWTDLDLAQREELIKRTDRGVFSVAAQRRLSKARNVDYKSGSVFKLEIENGKVSLHIRRGNPPTEQVETYDRVVVALGFDPWKSFELLPQHLRPLAANPAELRRQYLELEKTIDYNLCLPFRFVEELKGKVFNVHLPVVAGLAQGPGFPNLCSLGHLSDRILSRYIKPPNSAT